MGMELIYTSVPQGLKPGSRGFCTVACTEGMSPQLIEGLERLSGYRQLANSNASNSPVAYSYLNIQVGNKRYLVLSRVADAGLDYSQRSNVFAHHVVFEEGEIFSAGPAAGIRTGKFLTDQWKTEPAWLPTNRVRLGGNSEPRPCKTWQKLTGDAGWGGVLAETAITRQEVYLVFEPGMPVLDLINEAMAILPPQKRWLATFSTYFTSLPAGIDCRWKCVVAGTPEANAALKSPNSLVIQLGQKLPPPKDSQYVQAARQGSLVQPKVNAPARNDHATNVTVAQSASNDHFRLQSHDSRQANQTTSSNESGLPSINRPQFDINQTWKEEDRKQRRRTIIGAAVVFLLIICGAGYALVNRVFDPATTTTNSTPASNGDSKINHGNTTELSKDDKSHNKDVDPAKKSDETVITNQDRLEKLVREYNHALEELKSIAGTGTVEAAVNIVNNSESGLAKIQGIGNIWENYLASNENDRDILSTKIRELKTVMETDLKALQEEHKKRADIWQKHKDAIEKRDACTTFSSQHQLNVENLYGLTKVADYDELIIRSDSAIIDFEKLCQRQLIEITKRIDQITITNLETKASLNNLKLLSAVGNLSPKEWLLNEQFLSRLKIQRIEFLYHDPNAEYFVLPVSSQDKWTIERKHVLKKADPKPDNIATISVKKDDSNEGIEINYNKNLFSNIPTSGIIQFTVNDRVIALPFKRPDILPFDAVTYGADKNPNNDAPANEEAKLFFGKVKQNELRITRSAKAPLTIAYLNAHRGMENTFIFEQLDDEKNNTQHTFTLFENDRNGWKDSVDKSWSGYDLPSAPVETRDSYFSKRFYFSYKGDHPARLYFDIWLSPFSSESSNNDKSKRIEPYVMKLNISPVFCLIPKIGTKEFIPQVEFSQRGIQEAMLTGGFNLKRLYSDWVFEKNVDKQDAIFRKIVECHELWPYEFYLPRFKRGLREMHDGYTRKVDLSFKEYDKLIVDFDAAKITSVMEQQIGLKVFQGITNPRAPNDREKAIKVLLLEYPVFQ